MSDYVEPDRCVVITVFENCSECLQIVYEYLLKHKEEINKEIEQKLAKDAERDESGTPLHRISKIGKLQLIVI